MFHVKHRPGSNEQKYLRPRVIFGGAIPRRQRSCASLFHVKQSRGIPDQQNNARPRVTGLAEGPSTKVFHVKHSLVVKTCDGASSWMGRNAGYGPPLKAMFHVKHSQGLART